MRSLKLMVGVASIIALLAGCASQPIGGQQIAGTAVGAGTGALIGYALGGRTGAVVGALVGGAIGNRIGASLDDQERQQLALATQQAAETGQVGKPVIWSNTDKRTKQVTASGWIIPKGDAYAGTNGSTCRAMTQNVQKNGQTLSEDITLCKQAGITGSTAWVVPQG